MREISGKTHLFGILADPIYHVKTPQLLNAILREQNIDGVMVPFHVRPEHLAAVVDGLRRTGNLIGVVVTVPHKMSMLQHCDRVEGDAAGIGAVNVVRRDPDGSLVGAMLDGRGFVAGLAQLGHDVSGRRVYLAGAGGAANAIAFALAEAGVSRLTIANRSRARIDELIGRLAACYPDLDVGVGTRDPSGYDIIVNATSLGMREDDPLPLDAERLEPTQLVADIIMEPARTALLRMALEKGCPIYGGLGMLAGQVHEMLMFFQGQWPATADVMDQEQRA